MDNEGHFAQVEGKLEVIAKPHGHGDVHTLVYQHGLHTKWREEGRKWILLF
jgi:UDP-sugar pyrophosphorylase